MSEFDPWSQDEWWRTQNPGLSFTRGLFYGLGVSSILWTAFATVLWLVLK